MAESGPGDGRSIENSDESVEEVPRELPVEGEHSGDAGSEGERVSEPGEGLVPEEGVNEPGTRAGDD